MRKLLFFVLILPMIINAQDYSLVDNNTDFAFDLYHSIQAQESGNFMFSPYSISQAFALVYSGAAGDTATQIQDALNFLPQAELPDAFAALTEDLTTREYELSEDDSPLTLNLTNALWGQDGYPFNQDYLALMESAYGAGIREVNFAGDAESARQTINQWVSEQTDDRIQDIIPPGEVDELTRLVLTNAIYFKASWQSEFTSTQNADFTLLDGNIISVPMMQNEYGYGYTAGKDYDYAAVELPYVGDDMSMIVIMPDDFEAFEDDLWAERFRDIVNTLSNEGKVRLFMPRFEYEFSLSLNEHLQSLGVMDAFDPDAADFSGLADTDDPLYISSALHKTFIKVDEQGTEAAAATAVIVNLRSLPAEPVEIRLDRPFIYAIYDRQTGSVLFLGRVMNPAG